MSPIPAEDKVTLTADEVAAEHLDGWTIVDGLLRARFRTGNFATGLAFVNRIGAEAEAADHHPDIDLRYGVVEVAMSSHDVRGLTQRDVRLARATSAIAADLGIQLDA